MGGRLQLGRRSSAPQNVKVYLPLNIVVSLALWSPMKESVLRGPHRAAEDTQARIVSRDQERQCPLRLPYVLQLVSDLRSRLTRVASLRVTSCARCGRQY